MKKIESKRIEKVLPPGTKINVKGRPKNVKRSKVHYEHVLEKEKKDAKMAKKEEKMKTKIVGDKLIIKKRSKNNAEESIGKNLGKVTLMIYLPFYWQKLKLVERGELLMSVMERMILFTTNHSERISVREAALLRQSAVS